MNADIIVGIVIFSILILTCILLAWFLNGIIDSIALTYNLNRANKLLFKGLEDNELEEADIRLIYGQYVDANYPFLQFLKGFMIYVRNNDHGGGSLTAKSKALVMPIIAEEKRIMPYSNVDEKERRLLMEIENLYNGLEKTALKKDLIELSILIEANQKALKKEEKTNRWSVPTAVLGFILTLAFGLYDVWGPSISNNDIERITNHVSSSVTDSISKIITIENSTISDSMNIEKNN